MRLALIFILVFSLSAKAQDTFWIENFGTGCNQGSLATAYAGPNGNWTVTSTGTNAGSANVWYISATENGNPLGTCGSGCGSDRTLHLGSVNVLGLPADPGAAYYEGLNGFCGFLPCGATDKRVESPFIDCTGRENITLAFHYIEGGNTNDNATLWYYNGSTWSQIFDMSKTFSTTCSPQGLWTLFNLVLPASANNNPNIKIGFRWVNNDDASATDPSFAVDDITLTVPESGDNTPPVVVCPGDQIIEVNSQCEVLVPDFTAQVTVTDDSDPNPSLVQFPIPGESILYSSPVTITATDSSGNSSSCTFNIFLNDSIPPQITCPNSLTAVAGLQDGMDLIIDPAIASDACGLTIVNSFNGTTDASGYYPIGITEVTFTSLDPTGNSSSCITVVTVLQCCPADFNCDGVIGVSDLLYLVGNMGISCPETCPADLSGDGIVGVNDQLYFLGVFGTNCP
jgi:hypothetical protein